MKLQPEQSTSITSLLLDGDKMGAIKLFRDWTGCSLADAKTHIEQLESEIKAKDASIGVLPSVAPNQVRNDHIYGRAGLAQAIAGLPEPWLIRSFEDIPMGWSAELQLQELRVVLSSERNSLSAMSFVADQGFDPPYLPNHNNRSAIEVVRHFLESARSHWEGRKIP